MTGDEQRFEALYRAHYAPVVRFVRRRLDADRAEEVIAETFAIAWRRLDVVPAEPLPWLYVVARNLIATEHRTTRTRGAAAGFDPAQSARDPADAVGEREHVLAAFASLSEADREALRLTSWDGLSQQQAAEVCGTTRVAFAMRLSRARRRLAAALDREPAARAVPVQPKEARP